MTIWQKYCIPKSNKGRMGFIAFGLGITGLLFILSLCFGTQTYSPIQLLEGFCSGDTTDTVHRILMYVRLPRAFGALLCGSALAVSGVLIQAVLNNPLAGPNIIGINAGAGFCTLLVSVIFPYHPSVTAGAAFIGALAATLLIYVIGFSTGSRKMTIILAGVAINSILSAGMDVITTLFPEVILGASGFLAGGLSGLSMNRLYPAALGIGIGLLMAFLLSFDMNVLTLGDSMAQSLGMQVGRIRFLVIFAAALLAGAAVSFCGLLGFVGLIIPHIARKAVGQDHRFLVPAALVMGSSFVMGCDILSRMLFAPFEVPVGILMSVIGGPFFLYLILKGRRHND